MPEPILQIRNLCYSYPDTNFQTLTDINLTIEPGEFVLLVGPSGSGKSTLLQTWNGIIPKMKSGKLTGEILLSGLDVAQHETPELARKIGMVFQDPESQLTSVFVDEEVAFGPENFCLPREDIRSRVDRALQYVGLQSQKNKYVYEMSGGQQQRLAISSVLSIETDLLALDDPTANLDPVGTAEIMIVLERLRHENRTVVIATHWLDEFIHLATRLVILKEGRIYANGEPRQVLDAHAGEGREQLGIWIPQLCEVEMAVREKIPLPNRFIPLTVDEALARYAPLEFDGATCDSAARRPESHPESVVEAHDLCFAYPDGTRALTQVSFEIQKGSLTAILGPNGAGKSTLARLLVGLSPFKQGELIVAGIEMRHAKASDLTRRVGFVFQNPEHQFVRDTVRDEIAYSLEVLKVPPAEIQARTDEMLERLKLTHLAKRHPFGLSGGEKRRLSVAVMLVSHPELLILDEPTYGQDSYHAWNMMQLVQGHLTQGVTVIAITHDMRIVQQFADDVLVLRQGRVLYQGNPARMFYVLRDQLDVTLREPHLAQLTRRLIEQGKNVDPGTRTVESFVAQIKVPDKVLEVAR